MIISNQVYGWQIWSNFSSKINHICFLEFEILKQVKRTRVGWIDRFTYKILEPADIN